MVRCLLATGVLAVLAGCAKRDEPVPPPAAPGPAKAGAQATKAPEALPPAVAMVVAHDQFRDEELLEPKAILEQAGAKVDVVSTVAGEAKGMKGATVAASRTIEEISSSDYDAIVFIGGTGAKDYWDSKPAHDLCRSAVASGKILAAICIAPVTLARAGVLEGKQAVVWADCRDELSKHGARLAPTSTHVVVDGRIITGDGPGAAKEFGQELGRAMGLSEAG